MPALDESALRPAQIDAVNGLERALSQQRFDRSLIQMATGAGKTYTAITAAYRLLKFGGFRRILFLVDRNNLADQTAAEFEKANSCRPRQGERFSKHESPPNGCRGPGSQPRSTLLLCTATNLFKLP